MDHARKKGAPLYPVTANAADAAYLTSAHEADTDAEYECPCCEVPVELVTPHAKHVHGGQIEAKPYFRTKAGYLDHHQPECPHIHHDQGYTVFTGNRHSISDTGLLDCLSLGFPLLFNLNFLTRDTDQQNTEHYKTWRATHGREYLAVPIPNLARLNEIITLANQNGLSHQIEKSAVNLNGIITYYEDLFRHSAGHLQKLFHDISIKPHDLARSLNNDILYQRGAPQMLTVQPTQIIWSQNPQGGYMAELPNKDNIQQILYLKDVNPSELPKHDFQVLALPTIAINEDFKGATIQMMDTQPERRIIFVIRNAECIDMPSQTKPLNKSTLGAVFGDKPQAAIPASREQGHQPWPYPDAQRVLFLEHS